MRRTASTPKSLHYEIGRIRNPGTCRWRMPRVPAVQTKTGGDVFGSNEARPRPSHVGGPIQWPYR
jgi:hypothetical protein